MVKVIMGVPGTGKTKQLIEMVNIAINKEAGKVVCIEKGEKLRFEIKSDARLVDFAEYVGKRTYEQLFSFICGMYASNYDITHIFVDNLYKVADDSCQDNAVEFLTKLEAFAAKSNVKFTVTISAEVEGAKEELRKYF